MKKEEELIPLDYYLPGEPVISGKGRALKRATCLENTEIKAWSRITTGAL